MTPIQKKLLTEVENPRLKKVLGYICEGEAQELTPLACDNLIRDVLTLQDGFKRV